MGSLPRRKKLLQDWRDMPQIAVVPDTQVINLVESFNLFGRGIGYVDAHLIAAVRFTRATSLWTRDKRLHLAAESLGVAFTPKPFIVP